MKINKLLFFLLAVISLNSCVEYVNNGTMPDGPEKPEEQKYTAEQANPEDAKYIGDVFEFKAMLNGVDVTASTKFRVNGTNISGKTYTPAKLGDHSVIATMDNLTANFKFKVLEEEEEPEPKGNRIEYGGNDYPVSETMWLININGSNQILSYTRNGVECTLWALYSMEIDNSQNPPVPVNRMVTAAYVPMKNPTTVYFPNEVPASSLEYVNGGSVTINSNKVFDTNGATYTIATTGNSASVSITTPQPWLGTANYTIVATGANSGNSAKLFWDGSYEAGAAKISSKSAKGNSFNDLKLDINQIMNHKSMSKTQIKNLKIAK